MQRTKRQMQRVPDLSTMLPMRPTELRMPQMTLIKRHKISEQVLR
jgi:hypothetical protein